MCRLLDLSYNRIRVVEGLEGLGNLAKLFLVHNKITAVPKLPLPNLKLLELGDNRIRVGNIGVSSLVGCNGS